MMLVKPSLQLVLIACFGVYEAAVDSSDVPAVGKRSFSLPGTTVKPSNSSTMPNHLPEERFVRGTPTPARTGARSFDTVSSATTQSSAGARDAVSLVPEKSTGSWSQQSSDTRLTSVTSGRESPCNCSGEGVLETGVCDWTTGQCSCLPGHTGLRCEDCEDGHFNNGSSGCLPCSCDSVGSVSSRCDSSGTCSCKVGVSGSKCDDCQPGYYRFSSAGCRPCPCHNHSSHCHPQSGICLNCQGNTKGPSCEECKYNFYRSPGAALTDVCIPCPCSTVTSTGSCHIDSRGEPVCDQCQPEYEGPNCDQCRDGFYNSDSICLPCDCSGNEDPQSSPQVCHPDTGHCLSCANHTAGPHCERCAPGYSGDALAQSCTPIVERALPTPDLSTTTRVTNRAQAFSPSALSTSRTMSYRANATSLPTTATTQALLTSLVNPADNSTTAEVSWTQFNLVVLAVIIVVVVLLTGFVGGVYTYREYQNRKLNAPFWTIELKEDNISFSSYHDSLPNADVSGLLDDEALEVVPNGQLAITGPMNIYKA